MKHLKASDLRIGNWVYSTTHKQDYKIIRLEYDSELEYIEPIELSNEWLCKLNFFNDEFIGCYTNYDLDVKYFFYDDVYFKGVKIPNEIKYVHQLQNLYFSLMGFEISIK